MYRQGYAFGDGFNCLLDTARQKLAVVAHVHRVRTELEKNIAGPGRIRAGVFWNWHTIGKTL
eukprot:2175577-Karenia_brevis.AAC.1